MKKILSAFALLGVLAAGSAQAGIIRGAVDATATSEFGSSYGIGNTIDQSGLSSNYVSGVDDFGAYLSGNPLHSMIAGNEWFSTSGSTSDTLIYDLGDVFTLDAVALWIEDAWTPHSDVTFSVSTNGVDYTDLLTGLTLTGSDYSIDYLATVYSLTATSARYFKIDLGSCSGSGCSLGEIAFSTSEVPVPAAIWLFGSALLGFVGLSRRNKV
jgi:hypothetical protein